jgi:uncharacterized metal-binding protein YceD (DUF177 family)
MIAAAMTSRQLPAPTYVDLAKAGAQIQRDISPAVCNRLTSVAEQLEAVNTDLRFFWDDQGRVNVTGRANASLQLACQLCSQPVTFEVEAHVTGVLAGSEAEAIAWREDDMSLNIIVVSGPELDELELVEDELLLQLPSQVCVDADCEQRPDMAYGPLGAEIAVDTHRPFAALAGLKVTQQLDNESDYKADDKE